MSTAAEPIPDPAGSEATTQEQPSTNPVAEPDPVVPPAPGGRDPAAGQPDPAEQNSERPSQKPESERERQPSDADEESARAVRRKGRDSARGADRDYHENSGPGNFHVHYTQPPSYDGSGVSIQKITSSEVRKIRDRHVRTRSDEELESVLRSARTHLVALQGRPNQGRAHSALSMLAVTAADREISWLGLRDGLDPLLAEDSPLAAQDYLMDLGQQPWSGQVDDRALELLRGRLEDRKARLIVLVPDTWEAGTIGHRITHQGPALREVVRIHLRSLQTDARARRGSDDVLRAAESDPAVAAVMKGLSRPKAALALAEKIATWAALPEAIRSTEGPDVLGFLVDGRRSYARELLTPATARDTPRSQAYLLAAAVLDGESVSDVILAAQDLTQLLTDAGRFGDQITDQLFDQSLVERLAHARIEEGTPVAGQGPEADRRRRAASRPVVRLRDPALAWALLDVVWSDFVSVRNPLLTWLHRLASWPDETVRARVGLSIGHLATIDFSAIRERIFDPWALSDRASLHRAAAYALERCSDSEHSRDLSIALVRRWSKAATVGRRSIAVRAWGTELARGQTESALDGIRHAVLGHRDASKELSPVAASAFVELYENGDRAAVLRELALWVHSDHPEHRGTTAAAFLRIARIRSPGGGPDAKMLAEKDDLVAPAVAALWEFCLRPEQKMPGAWRVLRSWIDLSTFDPQRQPAAPEAGGHDSGPERPFDLVHCLVGVPPLRRKLIFYDLWWRTPRPQNTSFSEDQGESA